MSNRISGALATLFEKHRIVFWYDAKRELRADFESIFLPDVTKVEIVNNEYALKYRILREEPKQKFLLYHEGPQPEDLQNWLLDVLLAQGEFRADQVGLWLAELELGLEFAEVLQEHLEFFRAAKRRDALKNLLGQNDNAKRIRLKMLAVCVVSDARMDAILENLLQELADEKAEKLKLLERCGLAPFLWQQIKSIYGYHTQAPSLEDFSIELFKSCYAMDVHGQTALSSDALVLLKRWKDNRNYTDAFKALSERYAQALGIAQDLEKRDYREILNLDYFRVIDLKIISALAAAVAARTISHADLDEQVRARRQSVWYEEFVHLYEAIAHASQFLFLQKGMRLEMATPEEGVTRYCQSWFHIDQLYRRFIYHSRMSTQPTLMGKLEEQIENFYVNNFVLQIGNRFQEVTAHLENWKIPTITRQDAFFDTYVQPFLRKENKVCVIISDALRYEVGEELQRAVRQADKYDAELSCMHTMLPSYTQLGMAALLPHNELAISDSENGAVFVDGQSATGTENRTKILQTALKGRGRAITAEELLAMGKDETRELLKSNTILYIYHNRIDAAGDKKDSESKVFEAANETIDELVRLIKKLTGNNVSNILVTADHGFLYQNSTIAESDFADVDIQGNILYKSRRFVLGLGLKKLQGMHTFTAAQLGLGGDVEVQIPKSVSRLRLKGAGSRYVHGGASLQEIVIPVIKVNKKRQSDTSAVAVEILNSATSVITSGQLAVTLYQRDPVTDKMRPTALRIGIYTEEGELVSDVHGVLFDRTSENPRDREQVVQLILTSRADKANGKEVLLKLEEKFSGTRQYMEYASRRYIMRRSFTSDFDF